MGGDNIIIEIDGEIVDQSLENIYAINSKRTTKSGKKYIYTNYRVFMPYEYADYAGINDVVYFYYSDNKVYLTSAEPDGTVPAKKLSFNKQKTKGDSDEINKQKRFFILPKKFFPNTSENQKVLFTLDIKNKDRFSGKALLTAELVEKN